MGKHFDRGGVLELLAAAPTPAALRELGAEQMAEAMRPRSPRLAKTLPAKTLAALDAQTVVVPGTGDFGRVIAGVAAQRRDIHAERTRLATDLEARLEAHPLAAVLTSMPGVGLRTALKILTIVGDGSAFPTAGHLGPQERPVLVGLRQSERSDQPGLLRPETGADQGVPRCCSPTPLDGESGGGVGRWTGREVG